MISLVETVCQLVATLFNDTDTGPSAEQQEVVLDFVASSGVLPGSVKKVVKCKMLGKGSKFWLCFKDM